MQKLFRPALFDLTFPKYIQATLDKNKAFGNLSSGSAAWLAPEALSLRPRYEKSSDVYLSQTIYEYDSTY